MTAVKEMHITGVSRGKEFSPNLENNDDAIFHAVEDNLRLLGYKVSVCCEKDFVKQTCESQVIFNMARDTSTLKRLKELEQEGCFVVNSAFGIENCIRKRMTELLLEHQIPHPVSLIIPTDLKAIPEDWKYPCWVKRGDSHAMLKQDVGYAETEQDVLNILGDFKSRNIPSAVLNEHLAGDLVKFYGVQGTGFFYWYYSSPSGHSKFGLEAINGEARGLPFEESSLKHYADEASLALGVPVYGGDCVITSPGQMKIIDFNDWPSFSCCRADAGLNIAKYIHQSIEARY